MVLAGSALINRNGLLLSRYATLFQSALNKPFSIAITMI